MSSRIFPCLVFDTETTGIFDFKQSATAEGQPRMVAIAGGMVNEDGSRAHWMEAIIRPDRWSVPDDVAKLNGITTDRAIAEGRPIDQVMDQFMQLYDACRLFSCYGVAFDSKVLRAELRRLGRPDRYGHRPDFCMQVPATRLCNLPPSEKMMAAGRKTAKTPKLAEAVKLLLGRDHENAHGVLADAEAAADLYLLMAKKGLVEPKRRLPSGGQD